jgi:hypothetical protein
LAMGDGLRPQATHENSILLMSFRTGSRRWNATEL